MTVQEYITSKFQSFDIDLSEADLFDISAYVSLGDIITPESKRSALYGVAKSIIPMLLLRAKSVSENGFSYSYDTKDVLNFYAWLCSELGIQDTLNQNPTVTFL